MKLFNNSGVAKFVERPNRFIIIALLNGVEIRCHCPNTGRMLELLYSGVKIIVEKSDNPNRKTAYTVVAVFKNELVVPITSVRANNVAKEIIIPNIFKNPMIKSEVTYNKSRFDFLVEDDGCSTFIEVKACTLFEGSLAIFPDAPTIRGVKHLNELETSLADGYKAMVILVVFNPNAETFSPNNITDPLFTKTFKRVNGKITIIPYKVAVNEQGFVSLPENNPILPIIYRGNENDR